MRGLYKAFLLIVLILMVAGSSLDESGDEVDSSFRSSPGKNRLLHESEENQEGEGEGEEEVDLSAIPGGILLFTCITVVMVILWLVNSRSSTVRKCAWKLCNATISVFIAVLYYSTQDVVLDHIFGPEEGEDSSSGGRLIIAFLHVTLWRATLLGFNIFMAKSGRVHTHFFKAWHAILAHILSFAGKEVVNSLLHVEPFSNSAGFALLSGAIALVAGLFYGVGTNCVQSRVVSKEAGEALHEITTDTNIDVASVCMGFCFVQLVRFAVTGDAPSAELLEFEQGSESHLSWIFPLMAIVLTIVAVILQKTQGMMREGGPCFKVAVFTKMILVLTVSWSFIYWGDVQIVPVVKSKFLGLVLEAVIYSTVVVFGIILLDMIMACNSHWLTMGKVIDLYIVGASWIAALPWEQTFDMASEAVATSFSIPHWITRLTVSVFIAAVVTPSWYYYIFPKTLEDNQLHDARTEGIQSASPAAPVVAEDPKSKTNTPYDDETTGSA
eukprot:TRINITY_DN21712_c0_g6_i1.p1 TRINITY_DN21712_c0_g6~~TRINITY_DN21712_c0_g6_i1.p1  ORF type:complete len:497 (-),score=71.19 TRINITY_DN21712_c0_g6_i1:315-1805(-)